MSDKICQTFDHISALQPTLAFVRTYLNQRKEDRIVATTADRNPVEQAEVERQRLITRFGWQLRQITDSESPLYHPENEESVQSQLAHIQQYDRVPRKCVNDKLNEHQKIRKVDWMYAELDEEIERSIEINQTKLLRSNPLLLRKQQQIDADYKTQTLPKQESEEDSTAATLAEQLEQVSNETTALHRALNASITQTARLFDGPGRS